MNIFMKWTNTLFKEAQFYNYWVNIVIVSLILFVYYNQRDLVWILNG